MPARAERQIRHDVDDPRVLVRRDAVAHEGDELVRLGLGAVVDDDRGVHLLAVHVVGDAEDGGRGDVGVPCEHLLHLGRIHVVPVADDHVLLTVDDRQDAVDVGAEVAGAEPSVDDRLGHTSASASRSTNAISSAFSSRCTGTTIAPRASAP